MEKKNLIKSGIVVAGLVVASMFGFTIAHGYGGGSYVPTACSNVVYADWQSCSMGVQFRNVISQTPSSCTLTASQQAARVRTCVEFPNCSSVTYSAWGSCFLGVQSRNIIARAEPNCKTTPAQELARIKSCSSGSVLGEKIYADGTLLRGSNNKIYVVVGDKLLHIASLKELAKYVGEKIFDVSDETIASYGKAAVLGVKKYGDGQLIRNDNVKVYVIVNGQKKHILNLSELAKYYFGKPIYKVAPEELEQY
jgi:hypothetical protein